MARGSTGSRTPVPGALDRLTAQIGSFRDEIRGDLERLHERVNQVDARVDLSAKAASDDLRREATHLNDRIERFSEGAVRGIEQVRQELKDHERATTADVARGAVQGALSSQPISFKPNRLQLGTLVVMIVIFLLNFVEKAPPLFRAVSAFFEGVKDLDKDKPEATKAAAKK
jgi:Sec-independent protein translocase protein TatA